MGRIKTILVKRVTHRLMELYGDRFTDDFEENKQIVNELIETPSRKLRNIIAGYATRLVKKSREEKTHSREYTYLF